MQPASARALTELVREYEQEYKSIYWVWRIIKEDTGKYKSYPQTKARTAIRKLHDKEYNRLYIKYSNLGHPRIHAKRALVKGGCL